MNMLFDTHFFVGFMVSEIPRVSVFGYFPQRSIHKSLFDDRYSIILLQYCIESINKYILYYIVIYINIELPLELPYSNICL